MGYDKRSHNEGRVGIRAIISETESKGFRPFNVTLEVPTMADAEDLIEALGKLHSPLGNYAEWPCNIVSAELDRQKNRR